MIKKIILIASLLVNSLPIRADLQQGLQYLDKGAFDQASKIFAQEFEKGNAEGGFYLGRMLEYGLGTQADLKTAVAVYEKSVAKGSAQAQNRLGILYLEGKGVLQDFEKAAKLICAAGDAEDMNGAFNCGNLYDEGKGVKKDHTKAVIYYAKASNKGHIGAKNLYAASLFKGDGVKKDEVKATQLWKETADAGNPVGLYSYGQALALGIAGTKKDLILAHAYFNLAAARQHPDAVAARDSITKNLSSEDLKKAQAFARSWRAIENK